MIGKQFFPSSSLRSIFPCVRLPLGNRLKCRKPLKIQASRLRSATERRAKKGARRDSKSVGGDTVWVRVPPPAPAQKFLPPFRFRFIAKTALWQEFLRFSSGKRFAGLPDEEIERDVTGTRESVTTREPLPSPRRPRLHPGGDAEIPIDTILYLWGSCFTGIYFL